MAPTCVQCMSVEGHLRDVLVGAWQRLGHGFRYPRARTRHRTRMCDHCDRDRARVTRSFRIRQRFDLKNGGRARRPSRARMLGPVSAHDCCNGTSPRFAPLRCPYRAGRQPSGLLLDTASVCFRRRRQSAPFRDLTVSDGFGPCERRWFAATAPSGRMIESSPMRSRRARPTWRSHPWRSARPPVTALTTPSSPLQSSGATPPRDQSSRARQRTHRRSLLGDSTSEQPMRSR